MRIGNGFDSHRYGGDNTEIIIGGIRIPHDSGIVAHSDGDVLCHAIIDALLGACGLPDIGTQYPDTDPRYKNISSLVLLEKTHQLLREQKYKILNIDSVIICQEPKISPYRQAIIAKLANTLSVSPDIINIKSKSAEKMGAIGRGEGIAVHSVCLLERQ